MAKSVSNPPPPVPVSAIYYLTAKQLRVYWSGDLQPGTHKAAQFQAFRTTQYYRNTNPLATGTQSGNMSLTSLPITGTNPGSPNRMKYTVGTGPLVDTLNRIVPSVTTFPCTFQI